MEKLQDLMNEITQWSDATFGEGQRNPAIAYHLKKEVPELIEAIEKYQNGNTIKTPYSETNGLLKDVWEEYADCMMLLLDSANHFGLSAERLLYITKQKLEINKKRKWGKPDCNGVVEHVRRQF
jgi:NTP pyrophosphatase (non-canonical NTP hydrolase)